MFKKSINFILICVAFTACKSKKISEGNTNANMSTKNVIKNHYSNSFDKETLLAKMKVKYVGKSNLPGVTASLRMKKDETIWVSITKLGFPIGKVLITPDKVSYYEKINKTYFEGDFALLSNWLGTELDFEKVQNLILGQALFDLKKEKYTIDYKENNYLLRPKNENDLFSILFLINADNFKINTQEINQEGETNTLTISYNDYVLIDEVQFPKELFIKAYDGKYTSTVDVDYRSVVFDAPVSFPFSIPKNYEKIELKN